MRRNFRHGDCNILEILEDLLNPRLVNLRQVSLRQAREALG